MTRALRALSSAYVERRRHGRPSAALDTAGKRAAFALFYAPLHFIAATHVITSLGANVPAPRRVVDIGCGSGVAGAAWALASSPAPSVRGIDRHPWAVTEARWTYSQLGISGRAGTGELLSAPALRGGDAIVAAYVLNELPDPARLQAEQRLAEAANNGVRVLVLEPLSRQAAPWWDETAARLAPAGFQVDQWKFEIDRPAIVRKLDAASGLDHGVVGLRSLYHP